jgi:hypothetical protein
MIPTAQFPFNSPSSAFRTRFRGEATQTGTDARSAIESGADVHNSTSHRRSRDPVSIAG